jgi:hypothetical protein
MEVQQASFYDLIATPPYEALPESVMRALRGYGMMIAESRYCKDRGHWQYAVVRGEDKPDRRMWKAREGVEALIAEAWHAETFRLFQASGWYLGEAPDGYILAPIGRHNPDQRRRGLTRDQVIAALDELTWVKQ